MLVIFRSKAAGEVIMYERHAKPILDLLNRDTKRGIILADETDWAIKVLEQEIENRRAEEEEEKAKREAEEERRREDGRDMTQREAPVPFSARVFPFLEMLRAANKKKRDVVWGVP